MMLCAFQDADFSMPIDSKITDYISGLVEGGVQNVNDIESRVKELSSSISTRPTNRRYNPSRKQVYNAIYHKKNKMRYYYRQVSKQFF